MTAARVDKEGPISLELLTKLLVMGAVFLATSRLGPRLAIVSTLLSTFVPDVVQWLVRKHHWGKKRVGLLAGVVLFFASIDSAFARSTKARASAEARKRTGGRRPHSTGVLRIRRALGTSVSAAAVFAVAVATVAVASSASPFQTAHRAGSKAPGVTMTTTSTGPALSNVQVPKVQGLSQADTEQLLTGAGLSVGSVSSQSSSTVPSGDVISTDPPSGADVKSGSAVNIAVSGGGT